MANVGVIGAGSWGTALAILLCKNGHNVTMWSYNKKQVDLLLAERENKSKLPGIKLPEEMMFTDDLEEGMRGQEVLVLAVPSIHVRDTARKMKPFLERGQIIVSVSKGIEENTW